MLQFTMLYRRGSVEHLGSIPDMLSEDDPRTGIEQFSANSPDWILVTDCAVVDPETGSIQLPGKPQMLPLATAAFRDDVVFAYNGGWVGIAHQDGAFDFGRALGGPN